MSRVEVQRVDKRFYVTVRQKFIFATSFSVLWFTFSLWLAQPWIQELSAIVTPFLAYPTILIIALIPGFLNAHILMSVLLDTPPPLPRQIMSS